jgi:hypothetical protein
MIHITSMSKVKHPRFGSCRIISSEWHVGGKKHKDIAIQDVTELQADGKELKKIESNITGIPMMKGAVVMNWYGDHAKFIAAALKIVALE